MVEWNQIQFHVSQPSENRLLCVIHLYFFFSLESPTILEACVELEEEIEFEIENQSIRSPKCLTRIPPGMNGAFAARPRMMFGMPGFCSVLADFELSILSAKFNCHLLLWTQSEHKFERRSNFDTKTARKTVLNEFEFQFYLGGKSKLF